VDDLLPGRLTHIFLVSILDAAILSWIALRLYRRRVRGMTLAQATAGTGAQLPDAREDASAPSAIAFAPIDAAAGPPDVPVPYRPPLLGRLGLAYCAGAAAYAAVMTWLTLGPASASLPPAAWVAYWWIHAWPVVPTLAVLLVLDRSGITRLTVYFLLAGAVVVAAFTAMIQLLRGSLNTAPITNAYFMVVTLGENAWLPLALLLITGWRRVRAVTPLVLSVTLLFGFASMVSMDAFLKLFNLPAAARVLMDLAALTSAEAALFGPFMLVSLPVGWLAWRLVRWLAGAFERKRFSDLQLVVDCWWVVVTAERIAMSLVTTHGAWSLAGGFAAFAAYRITVALALRGSESRRGAAGKRLLLLRVFGYQARTEALFDKVAQRWRFTGPVQLIAGVDLAMRTVDPGDLLAFVNGRLADNWVRAVEDIAPCLDRLDLRRDPDGRFRVNELYCRDDTWRPTLEKLLDRTDTVLMDLRTFRAQNAGCIFELEQLVRRVPTGEIVLVCDGTTDLRLLERVVSAAWETARRDGVTRGSGAIALVRMDRQSPRELTALMNRLIGGALNAAA
jgi:hypothetical protein